MMGSVTDLTKWGNWGTSLKWSRKWNDKIYSNNLVSFSNYFSAKDRSSNRSFTDSDGVTTTSNSGTVEDNKLKDLCFKTDNEYKTGLHNQLEFGVQFNQYNIKYNFVENDTLSILNMKETGSLAAVYIQNRWKPLDKFNFLPGLRTSYYSNTGKIYFEPRFQASYDLTERVKLKGSTGIFYQFANRIIREDIQSGSRDIWVLSDGDKIPVSKAIHFIAGASYETNDYLFDAEAYYKKLTGLTEYTLRFSQQFGHSVDYSSLFYNGEGYTRGIDFLVQKKYGQYTGWVGYTLSETRYHFPVYGSEYFSATQDVTHEVKIVNTYKLKKWTFSATWIFGTGMAYTRPIGGYVLTMPDSTTVKAIIPGTKNASRLPNYHRLDISAKFDFNIFETTKGSISFSIFNVYNRKNVWYKEFEIDDTGLTETNITLLGITPNITLSLQLR
jgi:ferric enterobactin receptor